MGLCFEDGLLVLSERSIEVLKVCDLRRNFDLPEGGGASFWVRALYPGSDGASPYRSLISLLSKFENEVLLRSHWFGSEVFKGSLDLSFGIDEEVGARNNMFSLLQAADHLIVTLLIRVG
jgi:hypothetical protein